MTEKVYTLMRSFTYAYKGENKEAQFINMLEPTSRHSDECSALKQAFFRAQHSLSSGEDRSDEEGKSISDLQGADVMVMIAMSPTVDLPDVMKVAKKLFSNGTAMIDGETKLSIGIMDRMIQDDLELMLGEYLVGFILASSLARLESVNLSKESLT